LRVRHTERHGEKCRNRARADETRATLVTNAKELHSLIIDDNTTAVILTRDERS
jgi:hypothetical protein